MAGREGDPTTRPSHYVTRPDHDDGSAMSCASCSKANSNLMAQTEPKIQSLSDASQTGSYFVIQIFMSFSAILFSLTCSFECDRS